MEEDVNPEQPEDKKEYEEIEIDSNNPIMVFCFMFMEYVKEVNPELYTKAHKYAQDHTDIDITEFEIDEFEDEIDDNEFEDDESVDFDNDYTDED